jgi:1-aminocyclopropane-1-carboxylate deaminase/D-cysteine desulfhydrase-like pyridoxal-dependent ACC family enzyme
VRALRDHRTGDPAHHARAVALTQYEERLAAAGVPRLPLRTATPLRRLDALSAATGAELWVKDEGAAGARYGGNKIAKLELLLAPLRPGDTVLTWGPTGSHHVLSTALYARECGAKTIAVLFPQPDSEEARRHFEWNRAVCARVLEVPRALVPAAIARERPGKHYIPAGGSNALGTLGAARIGVEIATAIDAVDEIVVPLGTGGTAAGLALGLALAGRADPIAAVDVSSSLFANRANVHRLVRAAARIIAAQVTPNVEIVRGFRGAGYAAPTPEAAIAAERARADGLALDPTYGAKALAALLARVRPGRRIVFVQTASARPPDLLVAD